MIEELCLFCGEPIPEGRQVCPVCEADGLKDERCDLPKIESLSDVSSMLRTWSSYFSHSHKHRKYDPGFTIFNMKFPKIAKRMADVIDSALRDGEQISMTDEHIGKSD